MTTNTTKRGVAALALVTAVLAATACSSGASTETAADATAASPAVAPDASTATTVLRATETDAPTTTTLPRPTATVDELVDVDGGRLHVRCVGGGDTTVVLIAGFNDGGDNWGRIEPALSQRARVCSSARFGTGLSDPPAAPQTFATSARDLHTLLSQIGEPGPYVVVGHSYGGAQAVTFAEQYPDEVDGLVLLDATPPTWTAAGCAVPDDGSEAAADFIARCPDPAHPTDNPEQLDIVAGFAEVAAIDTLGSLPLSVVTAARAPIPRSRPGRGNAPRRRVEPGPAALDVAVVGRPARHRGRHRPLHPTRPTRCRHRRDPTTPPGPDEHDVARIDSVGALRRPLGVRLPRRPRRPRRPDRRHHQPGVGSPPGDRPGRQDRHTDHQPRRPRRIRRRLPRQQRTLQRRDQPPLRHRLVGSPRRRRHRPAAVRLGLRRHVPVHRPRPPRRRRPCRPRTVTSRCRRTLHDGRSRPPRPHRDRRCRVRPRSNPGGARRRPDHLRRLLLRHPHRAPLRRTLPRRPAGNGARRGRRPRAGPRRATRRQGRLPRPLPRRDPRRLRARLPDHR